MGYYEQGYDIITKIGLCTFQNKFIVGVEEISFFSAMDFSNDFVSENVSET